MAVQKKALLSVYDKEGVVDFAQGLIKNGFVLMSTGGTARVLKEAGIDVEEVKGITGFSELLDGRVKTLHPGIHAGILALRDRSAHVDELVEKKIDPIDLVVVNLYPFEKVTAQKDVALEDAIEQIDIGGVALLRSAAKNFRSVGVVSSPARYTEVLDELSASGGDLSEAIRWQLALEAFETTSFYDSYILRFLRSRAKDLPEQDRGLPENYTVMGVKNKELRYGENPHQQGALYTFPFMDGGVGSWQQHQGKEISFNNIVDMQCAFEIVSSFAAPAVSVVKHSTPCGLAASNSLPEAFRDAMDGDRLSAFGGIVGVNKEVDAVLAKDIMEAGFLECIIAPSFTKEACDVFSTKKNLRIVAAPLYGNERALDVKLIAGGFLVQDKDQFSERFDYEVVTAKTPTDKEIKSLAFAWHAVWCARSNAIVAAQDTKAVGIGAGQVSRIDAVHMSLKKAGDKCAGSVLASDGFFPMPDSIEAAAKAGITAIAQPGGSIKDKDVIAAADEAGIAMIFTRKRCFKH